MSVTAKEISLKDLSLIIRNWIGYLVSKWVLIVFAGIVGLVAGVIYSSVRKITYTAECNFVLEESKGGGGLGQYAGLASMVGIDIGGGGNGLFQGDNIIELYKSRSILQRTLLSTGNFNNKEELLVDRYLNHTKLGTNILESGDLQGLSFKGDPQKFTIKQDSVLNLIIKNIRNTELQVNKPDKKLSIIKVTYKSKDQLFAKVFTETLVENVNTFYITTKTKKAIENVNILQKQTDSVKRELSSAIAGVAISTDVNPNPNPARQILRVPSQRRAVDVQANTAILEELVKNLEISKVSLRNEKPLIQIIDQPILPLESDKIGFLKGGVLGGFIFGFIMLLVLTVKYIF